MGVQQYDDQYFIDNGYWNISYDKSASFIYTIITGTEKWKKLFETCMRIVGHNRIITPEIIMQVIEEQNAERSKRRSYYKKLSKEEKEKRKAQRLAIREARKLKDANRESE